MQQHQQQHQATVAWEVDQHLACHRGYHLLKIPCDQYHCMRQQLAAVSAAAAAASAAAAAAAAAANTGPTVDNLTSCTIKTPATGGRGKSCTFAPDSMLGASARSPEEEKQRLQPQPQPRAGLLLLRPQQKQQLRRTADRAIYQRMRAILSEAGEPVDDDDDEEEENEEEEEEAESQENHTGASSSVGPEEADSGLAFVNARAARSDIFIEQLLGEDDRDDADDAGEEDTTGMEDERVQIKERRRNVDSSDEDLTGAKLLRVRDGEDTEMDWPGDGRFRLLASNDALVKVQEQAAPSADKATCRSILKNSAAASAASANTAVAARDRSFYTGNTYSSNRTVEADESMGTLVSNSTADSAIARMRARQAELTRCVLQEQKKEQLLRQSQALEPQAQEAVRLHRQMALQGVLQDQQQLQQLQAQQQQQQQQNNECQEQLAPRKAEEQMEQQWQYDMTTALRGVDPGAVPKPPAADTPTASRRRVHLTGLSGLCRERRPYVAKSRDMQARPGPATAAAMAADFATAAGYESMVAAAAGGGRHCWQSVTQRLYTTEAPYNINTEEARLFRRVFCRALDPSVMPAARAV